MNCSSQKRVKKYKIFVMVDALYVEIGFDQTFIYAKRCLGIFLDRFGS